MLNRLKKYEEEYCRNTYCGNSEGGDFRFEDRGSRLILTAPHAVRTFRDNRPKAPDLCTGALTRLAGTKRRFDDHPPPHGRRKKRRRRLRH